MGTPVEPALVVSWRSWVFDGLISFKCFWITLFFHVFCFLLWKYSSTMNVFLNFIHPNVIALLVGRDILKLSLRTWSKATLWHCSSIASMPTPQLSKDFGLCPHRCIEIIFWALGMPAIYLYIYISDTSVRDPWGLIPGKACLLATSLALCLQNLTFFLHLPSISTWGEKGASVYRKLHLFTLNS